MYHISISGHEQLNTPNTIIPLYTEIQINSIRRLLNIRYLKVCALRSYYIKWLHFS